MGTSQRVGEPNKSGVMLLNHISSTNKDVMAVMKAMTEMPSFPKVSYTCDLPGNALACLCGCNK
eukprot:2921915-Amphidinium_carterae.1